MYLLETKQRLYQEEMGIYQFLTDWRKNLVNLFLNGNRILKQA